MVVACIGQAGLAIASIATRKAREIYDLRLNADMVVLSSCKTAGRGGVPGEGLQGLARAFFFAGSRSLVATLWKIQDEPAAEIMAHFYEYLHDGLSQGEALQRAKLDLIQAGRHPRQWAGFLLYATGPEPVRLPSSSTRSGLRYLYGLSLLTTLMAICFVFWRTKIRTR